MNGNQVSDLKSLSLGKLMLSGLATIVVSIGVAQAGPCPTEREPATIRYNQHRGVVEGAGSGFEEAEEDTTHADQEILSVLDLAHQLMRGEMPRSGVGHYGPDQINNAIIESFEIHLAEFPLDWYSMREFGIALLMDKQYQRGFGVIKASYAGEPAMVRVALDKDLMGDSAAALTKFTTGLVRYAKSSSAGSLSGDAWFTIAIILQGKGDLVHALSNLDRAVSSGFDPALISQLRSALSKP